MADSNLDLSTPHKARKALADLASEQKRLKANNRSLTENLEQKAAAVTKITQRLSELEAQQGAYNGARGDSNADKYVKRDGSVRIRGEATDEQAYMPGLLDDAPRSDWQAELQDAVDDYNLTRCIRRDGTAPKAQARMMEIARKAPSAEIRKAFGDIEGAGAEWIPDVMLPQLERTLHSQRRIASLFETVAMADKNVILPYLSTGFRPYKKAGMSGDDPAQYTSSSMTTAQRTITATGMAVRSQVDADASEDSILAALPLIRQELVAALVDGEEDGIINGDATATHQDDIANWNIRSRWGASGLGGSADHRRCYTGLRARAVDVSATVTPGSENFSDFMSIRRQLDAPHGVEGDCVLITSPEVYLLTLINLDQVLDLSKFGPQYTALSGQLAQMGGMPVIVSDFVGADLNNSGLYDNTTTDQSVAIVCNRSRFKIGQRAGQAVELDKDISRGMYDVVATSRSVFYSVDSDTTKNVGMGLRLATS
jgi:hypothetical protein